ncbi:hypothetical protein Gasu2_43630 [Galdieria sulphuraria]|nr:hypothetical protein Gasu2_43630 [Galdieria sulphuraria]
MNLIFKSFLAQLLSNAGILTQEIELVVIKAAAIAREEETNAIYAALVDLRQTDTAIDALKRAPLETLQQLSNVRKITLLKVGSGELETFEQTLETVPYHPSSLSTTILVIIVVMSVFGFALITAIAAIVFWKMYPKKKAAKANHPTSDNQLSNEVNTNTPRLAYSVDGIDATRNNDNTETDDEIWPTSEHS